MTSKMDYRNKIDNIQINLNLKIQPKFDLNNKSFYFHNNMFLNLGMYVENEKNKSLKTNLPSR